MAVLKPRNRIFLIRLTQDEYETLRRISVDLGARNLSDFARSTLLDSVVKCESGREDPLDEVYRILSALQETVARIAERIELVSQGKTSMETKP